MKPFILVCLILLTTVQTFAKSGHNKEFIAAYDCGPSYGFNKTLNIFKIKNKNDAYLAVYTTTIKDKKTGTLIRGAPVVLLGGPETNSGHTVSFKFQEEQQNLKLTLLKNVSVGYSIVLFHEQNETVAEILCTRVK